MCIYLGIVGVESSLTALGLTGKRLEHWCSASRTKAFLESHDSQSLFIITVK